MRPLNLKARAWPRALGLAVFGTALLAACGGSDDAPATGGTLPPGGETPAAVVSGVAAVGAPLAGARVEFTCVAGTPASVTTSPNGAFEVSGSGITFPCVAIATGGTVGGASSSQALYAAVTGTGTNNVTTLTTLQLAYAAGRDLAAWVADMKAAPAQLTGALTSARLSAALSTLKANLGLLPTAVTLPAGFDPSKTAFAANGTDPGDKALDQLKASLAQGGASIDDAVAQAAAAMTLTERTPATFTMEKIGGFQHAGGASSAEIVVYDPLSKRAFTINGANATVDVLNLANPTAPTLATSIGTSTFAASGLGGINSVAVHSGVVAIAIDANPKTQPGMVALLRATDLKVLGTATVGALPDMVTFTPDGKYLLVANEGEPNSYGQPDSVDPEGSVSVIALSALSPTVSSVAMTVTNVGFSSLNGQASALRAAGVRLVGPGTTTVAQDLEPEYITVSADSRKAYVTLQENNAIATIDIAGKAVVSVKALGLKDHSLPGNEIDISDEDGGAPTSNGGTPLIKIASYPIKAYYMPDGIASFSVGTATYLVTANEGDNREWTGINAGNHDGPRLRAFCDKGLAPGISPAGTNTFTFDSQWGRLRISAFDAKNGDGLCENIVTFGGRSFSVWNADTMAQVYDSGSQFESRTAALSPASFNFSNDEAVLDGRSPAKGPEPEGVAVGRIGTKVFAFIGLERVGGVMVYDVTNPAAAVYVTYLNTRNGMSGDLGPEGVHFIRAAHSPNGKPLLLVGNEVSGTTAVFQLNLTY
ncbi:MAG: choice-of-anchor I family protein [Burkholderiaceae bacterium]